jgi:hypothetical protein
MSIPTNSAMAGSKRMLPAIMEDPKKPTVDANDQVGSHYNSQAAMPGMQHTAFPITFGGAVHLRHHTECV